MVHRALAAGIVLFALPLRAWQWVPRGPGAAWTTVKPETVGCYSPRLEVLRAWLATGDTAALTIVVHGQQIFEYGKPDLVSKVASVRKSILAMLYGKYVVSGAIDLRKTVKDLGLQEAEPFLPIEEYATLERATSPARSACRISIARASKRCRARDRCTPST